VVADWLLERNDPRGLFIATQLEIERARSDAERHAAQAREAALMAEHGEALLGPLYAQPRGATTWRRGFAMCIGIRRPSAARAVLAHPVARVVRELVVGEVASRHELALIAETAREGAPCLQRLVVGASGEIAAAIPELPPAPFAITAAAAPQDYSLDWISASMRRPAELRVAALRWGLGLDPERYRRPSSLRAPFVERYFFELLCIGCDDAAVARDILRLYRAAESATSLVPSRAWHAAAEPLRAHASARLAAQLWRYVEHHLEISYERPIVRDHPGLIWPLAVLWHPSLEPRLVAYLAGALDRRPAEPSLRKRREKLLAWLARHVDAPALAALATPPRTAGDSR
jgi:hypothetical protein